MAVIDFGLIGNGAVAALVDRQGAINWFCLPRFDGDPLFHSLLGSPEDRPAGGAFTIELADGQVASQRYRPNTAILETVIEGPSGRIRIHDAAPRREDGADFERPALIIRRVEPLAGQPRITIRCRPSHDYGRQEPARRSGDGHIRYQAGDQTFRLTTDAAIADLAAETSFALDRPINLVFGADMELPGDVTALVTDWLDQTAAYWQGWVRRLALPAEWQEAVIRAAITLRLCVYEETGATVAAMTTSLPEAPHSGRNWDYRFCWVRDSFFTLRALHSLADVAATEGYLTWLFHVLNQPLSANATGHIQPLYGIGMEAQLTEWIVEELPGFDGMGPVRIGNQAHEHYQHDTYGYIIMAAAPAFMDQRFGRRLGADEFVILERLGEQAWALHDQPDAGIWELRTRARIHTSSSLLCWAACDRLGKIAHHIGQAARARYWQERAAVIQDKILTDAWSEEQQAFVESFGGDQLDASVLLMSEVGFIAPSDPRYIKTVAALNRDLGRGPFMLRYQEADDFGEPEVGFNVCAFWRVNALARIGRTEEARAIFEQLLEARNDLGLMAEDTDFKTGAAWGNFPQTYSMAGIISAARLLSKPWESTV